MFRSTHKKVLHIPHGIALVAGLLALSSWLWTHQHITHNQSAKAIQEEATQAAVQQGGQALLDLGALLLRRNRRG